jgi:long-chain acyl-CoA synthetase
VPHESPGEDVGAAAVLREGAHTTPDELRDYMKQNVAAYQ